MYKGYIAMIILVALQLLAQVEAAISDLKRPSPSILLKADIGKPKYIDTMPIVDYRDFLRHTDASVDKTLLIKEIVEHPSKVLLIDCPRRWGKSTNLHMLKTFLKIEPTEPTSSSFNVTDNYKLFKYGDLGTKNGSAMKLKSPPFISVYDDILDKYQGKFPVIHMNFLDRTTNDYMESMVGLVNGIRETFADHGYIRLWLQSRMNDMNATDMQREFAKGQYLKFVRIRDHVNTKYAENLQDLETSVLYLSELLHEYHGKRVIVLIDEYDTPINMQLLNIVYPEDVDKLSDFFERFFHFTFNLNDHLEKAVLTGITQPCYDKWLCQVDGLTVMDARNNSLAQYYGFTRQEVEMLFLHFNVIPQLAGEAHERYNSYNLGPSDVEIYSPWSIVKFLNNGTVQNYWEKSGTAAMMTYLFDIGSLRWIFLSLLQGGKSLVQFQALRSTRSEFLELRSLIHTACTNCELAAELKPQGKIPQYKAFQVNSTTVDVILSYLWSTGYVTNGGKTGKTLRLPNQEVRLEMMNRMIDYYKIIQGVNIDYVGKVVRSLGDFVTSEETTNVELAKHLETLFEDMKIVDVGGKVNEEAMRNVLDMMTLLLNHELQFQAQSRFDENKILMLFNKEFLGVIVAWQFSVRSIDQVMEIAVDYQNYYKKLQHIEVVKFVGIGVTLERKILIKAGFMEKNT